MALRLSGITDVNILNAFRDIEDKLDELNSRQAPEAEVRAADVDDIHTKLDELALATKPDSFNIMMGAGPMSKPGYVPNPGLTSVFSDRVLHANGDWASPLNGRLTLAPTNQGGRSIAQDTALLNASLYVKGAIRADTIYCRRIVPAGQYCELYVFDNASAQTFTNQNEFYQLTTGWVQSEIAGMAGNTTTGTMTAKEPGLYRLSFSCTAFTGSANQDYEFAFFITGATANDHRGHISFLTTTDKRVVTLTGISTLAAGATVDVRAQNVTSAGKTMTVEDANFSVNLLFNNGTGA